MESRMKKYKHIRQKRYRRLIGMLSLGGAYIFIAFFLQSLPVSYAWFNASASSTGQIVNATTADLIEIVPREIEYGKNGKVRTSISIKNISDVAIPLRVELLWNNKILTSTSTTLKPNTTFSTNQEQIDAVTNKELQYRIIGFNQYIDEMVSVPIDQGKVNASKEVENPLKRTITKFKPKAEEEPAKITDDNKETPQEEPPDNSTNSVESNEQPVNPITNILEKFLKGH
ncbi:hypothetical protein ABES02_22075 [Neobacillus pocheonensis]|uniref:hypothetical protein n=1 Tax=Neobacillus pocheonensis TaxID=363869 RepID=UPI003D296C55